MLPRISEHSTYMSVKKGKSSSKGSGQLDELTVEMEVFFDLTREICGRVVLAAVAVLHELTDKLISARRA